MTTITPTNPYPPAPPRIVTYAQLRKVLLPLCHGWTWAEDAMHDLWKMGAPVPVNPLPGQRPQDIEEKRILLPNQFIKWWHEVQQRMGIETPGDVIYGSKIKNRLPTTNR